VRQGWGTDIEVGTDVRTHGNGGVVFREKGLERPRVPRQGHLPARPLGGFKAEAQVVEARRPTREAAGWAVVAIWAEEGRGGAQLGRIEVERLRPGCVRRLGQEEGKNGGLVEK
jgi:hypothetical protein